MIAWVSGVVRVMWQTICGFAMAEFRNENGVGGSSPRWMASWSPRDGLAVQPRRGAGLEPAHVQPKPVERVRQPDRRRVDVLLAYRLAI
ncbi:MAG: hypothetical protein WDM81_15615 [Rhizomicrobium sp.]